MNSSELSFFSFLNYFKRELENVAKVMNFSVRKVDVFQ